MWYSGRILKDWSLGPGHRLMLIYVGLKSQPFPIQQTPCALSCTDSPWRKFRAHDMKSYRKSQCPSKIWDILRLLLIPILQVFCGRLFLLSGLFRCPQILRGLSKMAGCHPPRHSPKSDGMLVGFHKNRHYPSTLPMLVFLVMAVIVQGRKIHDSLAFQLCVCRQGWRSCFPSLSVVFRIRSKNFILIKLGHEQTLLLPWPRDLWFTSFWPCSLCWSCLCSRHLHWYTESPYRLLWRKTRKDFAEGCGDIRGKKNLCRIGASVGTRRTWFCWRVWQANILCHTDMNFCALSPALCVVACYADQLVKSWHSTRHAAVSYVHTHNQRRSCGAYDMQHVM